MKTLEEIKKIYKNILKREANDEELINFYESDLPIKEIQQSIINSDEYKYIRSNRRDLKQLTEVLRIFGYNINSFIEIGSRDGHDADFIAKYWNIKDENCYIIEAHPDCYKNIVDTYPQYNTLNLAVSDVSGIIDFYAGIIDCNAGISSVLERTLNEFVGNKIKIEADRMDNIMERLNINSFDLCKIDVEGFGLEVLKSFGDKIKGFKAIQIEVETREVWANQFYYKDILTYLNGYGFEVLCQIIIDDIQREILFYKVNYD
jgi:FkbM family methyltransferase